MAMLLGAAQLLTQRRDFDGTVRSIFQPAEEHGRGAAAMLADGLLERFPIDEIYGLHNIPGMPAGRIATRVGGIMANEDNFVIRIGGRGGHAARPHLTVDPLLIGAEIVLALQSIVARSVDPQQSAVVSCTEFITDGVHNAIPNEVVIKGDTRSYAPEVQALLERRTRALCEGTCRAHGAQGGVDHTHEFAPTVNWADCLPVALAAARAVVGTDSADGDVAPILRPLSAGGAGSLRLHRQRRRRQPRRGAAAQRALRLQRPRAADRRALFRRTGARAPAGRCLKGPP